MTQPSEPFNDGSQLPPPPDDPFAQGQFYQDPRPYGSAPTLLKVAAIMNIVMGGLDILWCGLLSLMAILIATGNMPKEIAGPEGPSAGRSLTAFVPVLGGFALLALVAGILKLIGGIKLLRKSRAAWGMGLASGIIGCLQLWCSYFCILPMGIGIFTIVVMSLSNTRRYLRENAAGAKPSADDIV